ncbi:hypothetical protein AAEO56_14870 [Flavobacterium sp. DGU11]|uniref:Lipoprotein n=1 Tax=Flavobacterium arundinis TaxID=3139143 RepID=A0ABU9HZG2_9FLAO
MLTLIPMVYACNSKENEFKDNSTQYRAIKERDTAYLFLSMGEERFYGKYEIHYGASGRDKGDVRGEIKGDTLLGEFYFKPYGGGEKKRAPFVVLKKDGKLLLGKGVESSYLNISFYMPDIPIDYSDPAFIFEELHSTEIQKLPNDASR